MIKINYLELNYYFYDYIWYNKKSIKGLTMDKWKQKAKTIIKSELAKQDIDYPQLVILLKKINIEEDNINLANKINRGTFSFVFVLQIFKVLKIKNLRLED